MKEYETALKRMVENQNILHFRYITKDCGEFDLVAYDQYQKLEQEIDRLNNILDELEEWVKERIDNVKYNDYDNVLDKLKELKENK